MAYLIYMSQFILYNYAVFKYGISFKRYLDFLTKKYATTDTTIK